MKSNAFLGTVCAALLVSAPSAQAIVLTSTALGGNVNNGVLIGANTLGIDVGMINAGPATFAFSRTANSASIYDFSSVLDNLSGRLWGAVTLSLTGGATFGAPAGSLTPGFGSIASTTITPSSARVSFGSTGEPFGLNFGNPFGAPGLADWTINLTNLAGNSFALSVQTTPIPVPGGLVLMLTGLAGVAAVVRRKRTA